jgi:hypothetical protein
MEAYSQTLAMNDVTVNDNNENGYEMKNIAGSRNQRTDIKGSAYRLRGE